MTASPGSTTASHSPSIWRLLLAALALPLIGLWVAGYGTRDDFIKPGEKGRDPSGLKIVAQSNVEPPSHKGKYGGSMVDDTLADPKTFNIWVATDAGSFGVGGPLFDSLIGQNPFTQKWEAHLCDVPTISKDGLHYTFQLKPGLRWSDGAPLTADDIIFTLDMIFDTKTAGIQREGMMVSVPDPKHPGTFQQVPPQYRKVDDRTVEFTLPVPYAPALSMLSIAPAPRHILYDAWKSGNINNTWNISTPPSKLVGSGTWIMESYVSGQRVTYKRNPYYWKKDKWGRQLPYLDKYVQLIVPDINTSVLKFKAGETDNLSVPATDYPDIKRDENLGYTVYDLGPNLSTNYLGFNLNPNCKMAQEEPWKAKLFQNVKFRQAVSYAINRDLMCVNLYRGLATPAWSYVSPANKTFYNPNVPKYPYNPAKAEAMLDALGVKDTDGNGYREYEGHEVQITLTTNVENNLRKSTGIVISKDLKNVGLNVTFTPLAFNKIITSFDVKPWDWEAVILGFTGGIEPHDGANIWNSSGPTHQWNPSQKKPATHWEAEIDDLFRRGAQELNPAKRVKIYDRWQYIASEQLPMIYTVVPDGVVAIRNKFGNLKPCPVGGAFWNQDEIYDLSATRDQP